MKFYFKIGMWVNFIGSVVVTSLIILLNQQICVLFGADAQTTEYTVQVMPKYAWGFIMTAFNVMISAYLYSTERSGHATVLNILRSIIVSVFVIMLLPEIFGAGIIWYTLGIYEGIVLTEKMKMIITISREFGSGGRELGKRLADELGIP